MVNINSYIPAKSLYLYKISWVIVELDMPHDEITSSNILKWCLDNLVGKWTILKPYVLAFEYGEEALFFKMKFIIK